MKYKVVVRKNSGITGAPDEEVYMEVIEDLDIKLLQRNIKTIRKPRNSKKKEEREA